MTLEQLNEIRARCEAMKVSNSDLHRFILSSIKDLPDCLDEIERLQQELSLEKANAEMRRKEIRLGVQEIVRWRTEAERLLVKRPTNNCDCGNPINHDYCTRCLRQWES